MKVLRGENMKIIVLGAGLVGVPMAIDLTKESTFEVTVADFSNEALNRVKARETEVISMARTTGYTATLAIRMIAEGLYTNKGISPPEYMGKYQECIDYMQKGLKKRDVNWIISEEKI